MIDELERWSVHEKTRKNDLKIFEYFECDFCGKLCRIRIEQLKTIPGWEKQPARCIDCARKAKIKTEVQNMIETKEKETIDEEPIKHQIEHGQANKLKLGRPQEKNITAEKLLELKNEGLTVAQIADYFQSSKSWIFYKMRELKISTKQNNTIVLKSNSENGNKETEKRQQKNQKQMEVDDAIQAATTGLEALAAYLTGAIIENAWRIKEKDGVKHIDNIIRMADRLKQELKS